jgi:hypothetical protein
VNNRGQLTILLIVAAVLIVSVGVAWYLFSLTDSETPQDVTVNRNEVERFVESCLQSSVEDVLARLGERGGFVDAEAEGLLDVPGIPTEGPAFAPFGDVVPYWSYMSSPNDCTRCLHASQQPALEGYGLAPRSIQEQAEVAIEQSLTACIDGFATYADTYTITENEQTLVTVEFGEDTTALLNYSITVTNAEGTVHLHTFSAQTDIPLRRLYEAADSIRAFSDDTGYFEMRTLEDITLAAADNTIPPPHGGLEIGYDPGPFWSTIAITPIVADAIETGTNMVQLFGSKGADFIATNKPEEDNLYLKYYVITDNDYSDVRANFVYLTDWTPYLAVHPSRGQLIKPELVSSGIPFIPNIKRMDFQYDVSYPVLVQLRADTKRGDYLFQFPLEVNLRRNTPNTFTPVDPQPELQDVCSPETVNGATAMIKTVDQDSKPLAARVRFECVNAACEIGESQGGSIIDILPVCLQGVIIAEREGYFPAETTVDSLTGQQFEETLALVQYTTVPVELVGVRLAKTGETWTLTEEVPITDAQQAVIEFSRQGSDDSEFISIPAGENGKTTMNLIPGSYAVRVFIIENLKEPKVLRGGEECGGGVLGIGEECVTIPDITLGEPTVTDPETGETLDTKTSAVPVGGLTWDETTKLLEVSENDLAAGKLRVPVIVIDIASLQRVQDLNVYDHIETLSRDLALLPVPLDG